MFKHPKTRLPQIVKHELPKQIGSGESHFKTFQRSMELIERKEREQQNKIPEGIKSGIESK